MNLHSVLVGLYERITHIVTPIHLCMNEVRYVHVWSKGVYVKVCSHICIHTHTCIRSSQERGFEWCIHVYPKLDDALHMLCSCEGILYMI